MQHRQRRTQFVRHIGHEIAPHLLELQQAADVARDQQPQLLRVRQQAKAERHRRIERRGYVERLGVAPAGQPGGQRQPREALDDRRFDVRRIAQAQQRRACLVEPDDALRVALDHDDRIRQHRRRGAIGAQHRDQPALAQARTGLPAMQQALDLPVDVPRPIGPRSPARGQPGDQPAHAPHVPAQRHEGAAGHAQFGPPQRRAREQADGRRQRQQADRAQPSGAGTGHVPQSKRRRSTGGPGHSQPSGEAENR